MKNIGEDWNRIGGNRKVDKEEEDKIQRQSKKKKKLSRRNWKLGSEQKKIMSNMIDPY